ncbi:glycosyltransferase family 2 protein [Paenibacillus sp. N1-5-1-14]|uniref:glycosyltransferase family 2 protein n=1 Tax=Paenibacillus radicibacter TaxID=2972488 RepID=UPI002159A8B1|nr:glycosyltransferase family 2 protein [Paenibacillus radicibacter]MCR8643443.1 glycosyltransferase family 2 protein [Paenibacillus radicibacter]
MADDQRGVQDLATLISHFYNEQYLLPWWLMHHTAMFDHGILINRGSTDRSVEMCKLFAPNWEVRDSKVPEFDAIDVDREVMEIEEEVSGWKMTLNTTEFLCSWNQDAFFKSLDVVGARMYSIRLIMMVDDPKVPYPDPVYTLPLVKQRHHGFLYYEYTPKYNGRFIHNFSHGDYCSGRHESRHPYLEYLAPAFVIKFYYSPWNHWMRMRKLQIGPTLSEHSRLNGLGIYHLVTPEQMEIEYHKWALRSQDLRTIPAYQILGLHH